MANYYFFDGYNLLYAQPEMKALLKKDLKLARLELIESVLNFLGQDKSNIGHLVFDGPNELYSQEAYSDQLKIYFGKTADQIIEKISKQLPLEAEVTLLSSDNTVFQGILGNAKLTKRISAEDFWRRIKTIPRNYSSKKTDYNPLMDNLNAKTFQELDKLRR